MTEALQVFTPPVPDIRVQVHDLLPEYAHTEAAARLEKSLARARAGRDALDDEMSRPRQLLHAAQCVAAGACAAVVPAHAALHMPMANIAPTLSAGAGGLMYAMAAQPNADALPLFLADEGTFPLQVLRGRKSGTTPLAVMLPPQNAESLPMLEARTRFWRTLALLSAAETKTQVGAHGAVVRAMKPRGCTGPVGSYLAMAGKHRGRKLCADASKQETLYLFPEAQETMKGHNLAIPRGVNQEQLEPAGVVHTAGWPGSREARRAAAAMGAGYVVGRAAVLLVARGTN